MLFTLALNGSRALAPRREFLHNPRVCLRFFVRIQPQILR